MNTLFIRRICELGDAEDQLIVAGGMNLCII